MPFELEIRLYPLFCHAMSVTCSNMQLNYKYYTMVSLTRIQKNKISFKSSIVWYIRLQFFKIVHLDVFYNIYSVFFFDDYFLKICQVAF